MIGIPPTGSDIRRLQARTAPDEGTMSRTSRGFLRDKNHSQLWSNSQAFAWFGATQAAVDPLEKVIQSRRAPRLLEMTSRRVCVRLRCTVGRNGRPLRPSQEIGTNGSPLGRSELCRYPRSRQNIMNLPTGLIGMRRLWLLPLGTAITLGIAGLAPSALGAQSSRCPGPVPVAVASPNLNAPAATMVPEDVCIPSTSSWRKSDQVFR